MCVRVQIQDEFVILLGLGSRVYTSRIPSKDEHITRPAGSEYICQCETDFEFL